MTDSAQPEGRPARLRRLAQQDHEANCRNEPEWPYLSIQHRHVHDINALRRIESEPSDD